MAKPKKGSKAKKNRRDEDDEVEEDEELSDIDEEVDDEEEEDDGDRRGKKKKRKSAYIDEAAEEDDDEEEEDTGRVRRLKRNRFIDDIAAVDEDEDDEEEDDEVDDLIHDEGEELPDERDLARVYRRVEADQRARDADMSPEELEEYVKRRFERPGFDAGDMGEEQAGVVGQQGLLPTIEDPKLWLVELKAGTEREAVICLMQKAVDLAAKGTPLLIKSAFVQDHLKGYMYVEAYKEAHVKEAIRGLRVFYQSKGAKLVPLKEMVDAITVNRKAKVSLAVGSWVRPRAGMYKNDLGRIYDVDAQANKCTVMLIPRLDYAGMAQRREEGRGLPFGRTNNNIRPSAKPFSEAEAREHRLIVEKRVRRDSTDGGYIYFLNGNTQQYYADGYLFKQVSIKSLLLVEGLPPVDELTRFNQVKLSSRQADGEVNGELASLMQTLAGPEEDSQKTAVKFSKGDAVIVVEGDLKSLLGRVVNVTDDGKVFMQPQIKDLDVLPFEPSQLSKHFKSGDHVKVVNGAAAGQTGMVVSVDTETGICVILTDAHKEELRVFTRDLSESQETASAAHDTWGEYELHNLVVLDQTTVGVIVAIEADSARVLTNQGGGTTPSVRVCKPQDVKKKLFPSRSTVTHDRAQNSVSAGDIVDIKEGPLKDRSGTVKYVHRMFLFLHSKDIPENGGFVCIRGRQCVLRGGVRAAAGGGGSSVLPMRSPAPHRFGGMNGVNASPRRDGPSGMTGSSAFGNIPTFSGRTLTHRDDHIVGQSITIAKGPFRGYKGTVVSATPTHIRMELQAQYKTVTVDRKFLPPEYAGPQPRRAPAFGMTPSTPHHPGSRTPGQGGQTSMHSWGSQTPSHNPPMTPSHPGAQTPGRDSAWNPGMPTPRHPSMDDRADTPNSYYGGAAGTPGYSGAYTPAETPAGTPGGPDVGAAGTPGYDLHATTPYGIPAGTPGYAETPGGYSGTPAGIAGTPGYTPAAATPQGTGLSATTPGTPGYDARSPAIGDSEGATEWELYVGVAVFLGDGKVGIVRSADPSGQCQVVPAHEAEDGRIVADADKPLISMEGGTLSTLELVKKNTRVKVLKGESRGMFATCIATSFPDGVIRMHNEEVKVLDLNALGRVANEPMLS
eukprot:jgi/Botrbrau1/3126/Bobra.0070s0099.1